MNNEYTANFQFTIMYMHMQHIIRNTLSSQFKNSYCAFHDFLCILLRLKSDKAVAANKVPSALKVEQWKCIKQHQISTAPLQWHPV